VTAPSESSDWMRGVTDLCKKAGMCQENVLKIYECLLECRSYVDLAVHFVES
jgi:hypothetical protein